MKRTLIRALLISWVTFTALAFGVPALLAQLAEAPKHGLSGGGAHKIISIRIQEKERRTPGAAPELTMRVGEKLPLRVLAAWKIPYVGEVTDRVALKVSNRKLAEIGQDAVLVARRPGKVTVEATLRVADRGKEHELLAPAESAGGDPVVKFRYRVEVTITR